MTGPPVMPTPETQTALYRPLRGETVAVWILKKGWRRDLVGWRVRESWDGEPPFRFYIKTKWVSRRRIIS